MNLPASGAVSAMKPGDRVIWLRSPRGVLTRQDGSWSELRGSPDHLRN
jgi:NADPH:quinone reductase-like Zn-dependent oxidoreductase